MKALSALLVILFTTNLFAGEIEISLSEAIKQNLVEVSFESEGGFHGKTVSISLKSISKKPLKVSVPMGLTLISDNPDAQDQVISRNYIVVLDKYDSKKIMVNTFCIQQHNMAPSEGELFTIGSITSNNMQKLLRFLRANGTSQDAAQDAVWVLTNNNGIENIYSDDMIQTKNLQEFMANITNQELPWYSVEHTDLEPGVLPEEREPVNIHAVFEFELKETANVTLSVCNDLGEEVFIIVDNQTFKPGKGGLRFTLEVNNVEAGNYFVRLTSGDNVLEEKQITIS